MKKILLVVGCLGLVVFLSGCAPGQGYPVSTPSGFLTNACYFLEEGVTVQVDLASLKSPDCNTQFGGKTYIRIRQQVRIVNAKITEGKGAHPNGDCSPSYYGSLREVGKTIAGAPVFWESENHLKDDLKDFILVFLKEEKDSHYFDVYFDQAEKDNIPDFVKNCKETGGLIPVVEPPNSSFPPQFFEKTKINKTGFENNYAKYEIELKDYYVKIQEIEKLPEVGEQIGKYTLTLGGETKTYDVFFHAGTAYLKEGTNKPYLYNPSDTPPPSTVEYQGKTLKLNVLQFVSTAEWTWATPECKPVIYLYPEEPTNLNIKINPFGYLTKTDPPYDPEKGWEITVYPDGTIEVKSQKSCLAGRQAKVKSYPYLFYEGVITKFKTPDKGWVIRKENLPGFFTGILPQLGLNEKEATDFKEYWLDRLTNSPYFLVSLLPQEEIERIEPLEFSIKPDTFLRVRFYFKDLDSPISTLPPKISPPSERKGFTVAEWGGLYKENF